MQPLDAAKAGSILTFSATFLTAAAAYWRHDWSERPIIFAWAWAWTCWVGVWGMSHFILLVLYKSIDKESTVVSVSESLWYYAGIGIGNAMLNIRPLASPMNLFYLIPMHINFAHMLKKRPLTMVAGSLFLLPIEGTTDFINCRRVGMPLHLWLLRLLAMLFINTIIFVCMQISFGLRPDLQRQRSLPNQVVGSANGVKGQRPPPSPRQLSVSTPHPDSARTSFDYPAQVADSSTGPAKALQLDAALASKPPRTPVTPRSIARSGLQQPVQLLELDRSDDVPVQLTSPPPPPHHLSPPVPTSQQLRRRSTTAAQDAAAAAGAGAGTGTGGGPSAQQGLVGSGQVLESRPSKGAAGTSTRVSALQHSGPTATQQQRLVSRVAASYQELYAWADQLEERMFQRLAWLDPGVLVFALFGPIVFGMYLKNCVQAATKGDYAQAHSCPMEIMAIMYMCLALGRLDYGGMMHRFAAARRLLHDAMPVPVVEALLAREELKYSCSTPTSSTFLKTVSSTAMHARATRCVAGTLVTQLQRAGDPGSGTLWAWGSGDCADTSVMAMAPAHSGPILTFGQAGVLSSGQAVQQQEVQQRGPLQLPPAAQLTGGEVEYAAWHDSVTLLFSDICGFTELASKVEPQAVLSMLNTLFSGFDELTQTMPVYKVETVGDAYLASTGLVQDMPGPAHADSMVRFALAMMDHAHRVMTPLGMPVQMRVGINSGRFMSGVVGRIRRRFCIYGDTVNTTSRMETASLPGRIHASAATVALLEQLPAEIQADLPYRWELRGALEVKGKGKMDTYWILPVE